MSAHAAITFMTMRFRKNNFFLIFMFTFGVAVIYKLAGGIGG